MLFFLEGLLRPEFDIKNLLSPKGREEIDNRKVWRLLFYYFVEIQISIFSLPFDDVKSVRKGGNVDDG